MSETTAKQTREGTATYSSLFQAVDAKNLQESQVIADREEFPPELIRAVHSLKSKFPEMANRPDVLVARELIASGFRTGQQAETPKSSPTPGAEPVYDQSKKIREMMHVLVGKLNLIIGWEHSKINSLLNSRIGVSSVNACTIEQLRARYNLLIRWLKEGSI